MHFRRCLLISASVFLLFLMVHAAGGLCPAFALEVGVAETDITPPVGMPMRGYASRKGPSRGIWDPLMAKAVVLDDGKTQAAIISLDLIASPPKDVRSRISHKAQREHGISLIFHVATHTHSGPVLKPNLPSPENQWLDTLEAKLIEVIGQAVSAKEPAIMSVGYGESDFSYDRREVRPDGTVNMLFRNPDRKQPAPVDQTVGVVAFRTKDNEPLATLVHFACHSVVFGGENQKYSADYSGALCAQVEDEIGGTCVFLQGAAGDVNPYTRATPDDEGYARLRESGKSLGKDVVRIMDSMETIPEDEYVLTALSYSTELDHRFDMKSPDVKEFYISRYGEDYYNSHMEILTKYTTVETPILLVGKSVAWVGFPGEFFDDFQVDLKKRSPIPHTFFLGYCNGLHSYFPTIQAASEGGYGASYATYVEVGAGEWLVDRAVITLHTLVGNLKSHPVQ